MSDVAHADRVAVPWRLGNTDPQRFTSLIIDLEGTVFGTLWLTTPGSVHGTAPSSRRSPSGARGAGKHQSQTAFGGALQVRVHKLQAGHSGDLAEVLPIARDHMNG